MDRAKPFSGVLFPTNVRRQLYFMWKTKKYFKICIRIEFLYFSVTYFCLTTRGTAFENGFAHFRRSKRKFPPNAIPLSINRLFNSERTHTFVFRFASGSFDFEPNDRCRPTSRREPVSTIIPSRRLRHGISTRLPVASVGTFISPFGWT